MGMLTAPRNAMIGMLVQCHRLLNWQGNAFNEASLREHIYSDALPLLDGGYDRAELEQMRPYILVGHDADQALHVSREGSTAPWWKGNGALELMFEVNCKDYGPDLDDGQLQSAFTADIDAVLRTGDVQKPGILDLVDSPGSLHIVSVAVSGPYRTMQGDVQEIGDAMRFFMNIRWGIP